MSTYEIHTSNLYLDGHRVFLNGHDGDRIPFVLDKSVPDHQWQLFHDGKPVTRKHDLGEHIAADVRRVVQHHREKVTCVTDPEAEARPPAAPSVIKGPIQPVNLCETRGGQIAWQL